MKRHIALCAALLVAAGTAVAQTPVDTGWTYQGRLTSGGAPATGSFDMRFTLYSNAAGTVQVGVVQNTPGVTVSAGLFTQPLNFGAQFTGFKRWLKVEVSPAGAGTYTALPLTEITSAPQSLLSQVLVLPYAGSGSVASPNALFKLTNTDPSTGTAIWGQTAGTNGVGVLGDATATTGFTYGGIFSTVSPDGRGLKAEALATTGLAIGARCSSASTGGIGVWSTASATSGTTYGVYGDSFSTSGFGVHGRASATTGGNYGVYGLTLSNGGIGVLGTASATSGATYGMYGQNDSTSGSGVYGIATSTTGFNFGGHFFSNSPDGRAIRAVNNATTGQAVAGRFGGTSPTGITIWTSASATSGVNYALFATTASASGYGGYFRNDAVGGTALWADGLAKVKTLQILGGADLAEPFNINIDAAKGPVQPGMVVVIDESSPGDLRLTDRPYDTQVAGVISGANGLEPGMVMKAVGHEKADGEHPVAMTGRVWCFVDASFGAIKPGDRLTTSTTPGHAMKADDAARCGGAVIGKAMTELKEGKGLVLVLVNLQ